MQTKWLGILAVGALVGSYGPTAAAAPPDMDDVPLTLSGCVVAGEAKDSYLLTNVVVDGTTMAPPNAFYRFNTTKGLKGHVGHRVEVRGKADLDDVDKGKVKVQNRGWQSDDRSDVGAPHGEGRGCVVRLDGCDEARCRGPDLQVRRRFGEAAARQLRERRGRAVMRRS